VAYYHDPAFIGETFYPKYRELVQQMVRDEIWIIPQIDNMFIKLGLIIEGSLSFQMQQSLTDESAFLDLVEILNPSIVHKQVFSGKQT